MSVKDNSFGIVTTNPYADIADALIGYNGSTFIRELIQNANDSREENSGKVVISFDFYEDQLVVENNTKFKGDFTNMLQNIMEYTRSLGDIKKNDFVVNKLIDDDWASICIQRSGFKSKSKRKRIGKFGIGFRSVFHLCDEPIIESDYKKIKFEQAVRIIRGKSDIKNTKFTFVYRKKQTDVAKNIKANPITNEKIEIYYSDALNSKDNIIFLDNIQEINILKKGKLTKKISRIVEEKKIIITETSYKKELKYNEIKSEFVILENECENDENNFVAIVFSKDSDNQDNKKRIYAWFPLNEYEVNFPFYINANFEVNSSREHFNEEKQEFNENLLKKAAKIIVSNINIIKDLFKKPEKFYKFLLFNDRIHRHLSILKDTVEEYLKSDNSKKIIYTKLGWLSFEESYFIDYSNQNKFDMLKKIFFILEKDLGSNYFDPSFDYYQDYYDFLKKIGSINTKGRENIINVLTNIKNGKIENSIIKNLDNLIEVYNFLKKIGPVTALDQDKMTEEIINLNIFLDEKMSFHNSSDLHIIPKEFSFLTSLLSVTPIYIDKEYKKEMESFYEFSQIKKLDISLTINKLSELYFQEENKIKNLSKNEIVGIYKIINKFKEKIRDELNDLDKLKKLPIFYTMSGEKVPLDNNAIYFAGFEGFKPKTGLLLDDSLFKCDELEGFKDFLVHLGVKTYSYNDFLKNEFIEQYTKSDENNKKKLLNQLLNEFSGLGAEEKKFIKDKKIFLCVGGKYKSIDEGLFFHDDELNDNFGDYLSYINMDNQILENHKTDLEGLGILNHPNHIHLANSLITSSKNKNRPRVIKILKYFLKNLDKYKSHEQLKIELSNIACIPEEDSENFKRGDEIYSLFLKNQLSELDNIHFWHKDFHALNPNKEFCNIFGINMEAPTILIIQNLLKLIKLGKLGSYEDIYRVLNNRSKDENQIIKQELVHKKCIAIKQIMGDNEIIRFYYPWQVFWESTYLNEIDSKYVANLPQEYMKFDKLFNCLEVKKKVDYASLIKLIITIRDIKKLDGENEESIKKIYLILSRMIKEGEIQSNNLLEFRNENLILIDNLFKKPSEVFLSDNEKIKELFRYTNIYSSILPLNPDLSDFYEKIGVEYITHVARIKPREFINPKLNTEYTTKLKTLLSKRVKHAIETYFTDSTLIFEEIKKRLESLDADTSEVFSTDDIIVDVSIDKVNIKPEIKGKSIEIYRQDNRFYLSDKFENEKNSLAYEMSVLLFNTKTNEHLLRAMLSFNSEDDMINSLDLKVKETQKQQPNDDSSVGQPKTEKPEGSELINKEAPKNNEDKPINNEPTREKITLIKGTEPSENEKKSYYVTSEWKKIREECLKNANYICEDCKQPGIQINGKKILQAHHKTYERFGKELIEDLVCLCRECHEKVTGQKFQDVTTENSNIHKDPDNRVSTPTITKSTNVQQDKVPNDDPLPMKIYNKNDNTEERESYNLNKNKSTYEKYLQQEKTKKNSIRNLKSQAISDPLDTTPLSLEEQKQLIEKIQSQQKQGIGQSKNDFVSMYDKCVNEVNYILKNKPDYMWRGIDNAQYQVTKMELSLWYNGKCQICGETFQQRNGSNYFVLYSIIEFRNGGDPVPGNALCLCPEHWAKLKYGMDTELVRPDKIMKQDISKYDNKFDSVLKSCILGKDVDLYFKKEHIMFIQDYWKDDER